MESGRLRLYWFKRDSLEAFQLVHRKWVAAGLLMSGFVNTLHQIRHFLASFSVDLRIISNSRFLQNAYHLEPGFL
jgi:hypothetical protein